MPATYQPSEPARCRASIEKALRDDPVVWLSSVQQDGRPHLVPVWFHWDGDRIVAFSKPNARKVDNLRDKPSVMLAIGSPGPDFDVELIEATAEIPDAAAAELMPAGFAAKYRELLRRAGLNVQRFAEVYSQPIVLRPTRFLDYGGRKTVEPATPESERPLSEHQERRHHGESSRRGDRSRVRRTA